MACFLQIPLMAVIDIFGSPRWLPLPWSDMADFVALPNGNTYISLGFFPRVLCYDQTGRFVASYPVPLTKNGVGLAVDDRGQLYYWALGKIFTVDENWNSQEIAEKIGCDAWYLDESYKPLCRQGTQSIGQVIGSPVSGGGFLFSTSTARRDMFRRADGSILERCGWSGNSLLLRSQDGKVMKTLAAPWYLSWAEFPFPASLAWIAIFLLAFYFEFPRDRNFRIIEWAIVKMKLRLYYLNWRLKK